MTALDLERLKALCEKATPGPWGWLTWEVTEAGRAALDRTGDVKPGDGE